MKTPYLFGQDLACLKENHIDFIALSLPDPLTEEGALSVGGGLENIFSNQTTAYLHALSTPEIHRQKDQPHWYLTFCRDFLSEERAEELQNYLDRYEGAFGSDFKAMAGLLIEVCEEVAPDGVMVDVSFDGTVEVDFLYHNQKKEFEAFGRLVPCAFSKSKSVEDRRLVERVFKNFESLEGEKKLTKKWKSLAASNKPNPCLKIDKRNGSGLAQVNIGNDSPSTWEPLILSLNNVVSGIKSLYVKNDVDVSVGQVQQVVEKMLGEGWNVLKNRELTHDHPVSPMILRWLNNQCEYLRPLDAMADASLLGVTSKNYVAKVEWYGESPLPWVCLELNRPTMCEDVGGLGACTTYHPRMHFNTTIDSSDELKRLKDVYEKKVSELPSYESADITDDQGLLDKIVEIIVKEAAQMDLPIDVHEIYLHEDLEDLGGLKVYAPCGFPDLDYETPYEYGFEGSQSDESFYNDIQLFMCGKMTERLGKGRSLEYQGLEIEIEVSYDCSLGHFQGPESDTFGERIGIIGEPA